MNAAVLTEYRKIEWKEVPIPEIGDEEVLVKVGYAGICGSDQHIYSGEFAPRTSLPLIQGHEFSGQVVRVGRRVKNFKEGDRVVIDPVIPCGRCAACELGCYPACTSLKLVGVDMDGGFAEYVKVKENMLYAISDRISDKYAAMVEFYSIGFHACNRAEIREGDTVVIWGGGRIGQSIMQAARTKTQEVIFVLDVLDKRLEIPQKSYENVITINIKKMDPLEVIYDLTNGRGVDVAFEAVGHWEEVEGRPNPIVGCVKSIRGAGTVCVLGLSDMPVPLIMKDLIWREARIVASRVNHGEFREVIRHLAIGNLHPDVLISAEMPGYQASWAFSLLEKEPENYLKILLKFS